MSFDIYRAPAGGGASRVIQTKRVNPGAVSASGNVDVTVTWDTPFADTNYTVAAAVQEAVSSTTTGALARQVRSRTASQVVIRVSTGTTAITDGAAVLHVLGIAD